MHLGFTQEMQQEDSITCERRCAAEAVCAGIGGVPLQVDCKLQQAES